jgi:hypothetical protein
MDENRAIPCMICGQRQESGILILSVFLCDECETEMVETDAQDVRYPYFIEQMKRVFIRKMHSYG